MIKKIPLLLILSLWMGASNAALVNHDSFFTDTDTDLDWLHLNNTTNISYNDVKAAMQPGGQFEGWHFATFNDLSTLYNNAGSQFSRITQPYGGDAETAYNVLSPLWGLTYSFSDTGMESPLTEHHRLSFMFDGVHTEANSWITDYAWMGYVNVDDNVPRSPSYPYDEYYYINYNGNGVHMIRRDESYQNIGSALARVSVIPIPAAVWLFSSGLLGLIGVVRRKEIRKSILGATCACLTAVSLNINAAVITHGNLTTDDTTNYITDTLTGRLYTRFDAFNLSYSDTLIAISAGGEFEGWSIATSSVAHDFVSAWIGVSSASCTGTSNNGRKCGQVLGWNDGDFGDNTSTSIDRFTYLSGIVGMMEIDSLGRVTQYGSWASETSHPDAFDFNYLLYTQAPSPAPIPAAIWLYGSGLIGLIGVSRRKLSS